MYITTPWQERATSTGALCSRSTISQQRNKWWLVKEKTYFPWKRQSAKYLLSWCFRCGTLKDSLQMISWVSVQWICLNFTWGLTRLVFCRDMYKVVSETQLLLIFLWSTTLQTYTFLGEGMIRNSDETMPGQYRWMNDSTERSPALKPGAKLLHFSMYLIWKLLFECLCVCLVSQCCHITSPSRHSWTEPEWVPTSSKDSQELWSRHSPGSKWRKQDLHISAEACQRLVAFHQGWAAHGRQLTTDEQLFSGTDMLCWDPETDRC